MNQTQHLLWLPGLLCDEALFKDVNQALLNKVVPDTATLPAVDSMQEMARLVLDNSPEKFILGGLSMGGILAFEVYRQAPERVLGLILMDTNAADEKPPVTQARNALVDQAKQGHFESITPDILLPKLIHPSRLSDKKLTSEINQMAINIGINTFEAHANALANRPDARPLLKEIDIPTLIVMGKNDLLCPIENHLLMAQYIPNCTLHILPKCGHLSTMEYPNKVGQYINNWLKLNFKL